MTTAQVPRIPPPSAVEFERDWLAPCRPVVIEGSLAHSRALHRWTPDYLAALLAGITVPVVVSDDGLSATIPGEPQRWRVVELWKLRAEDLFAAGETVAG